MTIEKVQNSFSAGELSPKLYGHTSIDKYSSGLKQMVNFFPQIQGGASNRAGFEYQFLVKDNSRKYRLIRFEQENNLNFLLEFSESLIRVFNQDGLVLEEEKTIDSIDNGTITINNHNFQNGDWVFIDKFFIVANVTDNTFTLNTLEGNPATISATSLAKVFELEHSYTEQELFDIRKAQSLDVMTLTHKNHIIRELTRVNGLWKISDINPYPETEYPTNLTAPLPSNDTTVQRYRYKVTAINNNGSESVSAIQEPVEISSINTVDNETEFTANNHDFVEGDEVQALVEEDSPLFNNRYYIIFPTNNTFKLEDVEGEIVELDSFSGSFARTYIESTPNTLKTIQNITYNERVLTFTVNNHGYSTGNRVTVSGNTGIIARYGRFVDDFYSSNSFEIASFTYTITVINSNTFTASLPSAVGGSNGTIRFDSISGSYNNNSKVSRQGDDAGVLSNVATISLSWATVDNAISYNIYREVQGSYSFIGNTRSNNFIDNNINADADINPPDYRNPLLNNNPAIVTYHQQRRVFANTQNNNSAVIGSNIGDYSNFSNSFPIKEDESYNFSLFSNRRQELRHLTSIGQLIALGNYSIFSLGDRDTGTLNPLNVSSKELYNNFGCSEIEPLVIGKDILYVQEGGQNVIYLAHNFDVDGLDGDSLLWLSSHLLEGQRIVDWTYCHFPFYQILCVTNKGNILSLIYNSKQKVWGWSRFEVDGFVESIESITESNNGTLEDVAYIVIERTINGNKSKRVERLHSRDFVNTEECFFVDGGSTIDTWRQGNIILNNTTLTSDDEIFNSNSAGNIIVIRKKDDNGKITSRARLRITDFIDSRNVTVSLMEYVNNELKNTTLNEYSFAIGSVSNLEHLEGETVKILADGRVLRDYTVSNGKIDLDLEYSILHIGLSYSATVETLDIDFNDEGLRTKTKKKNISEVTVNYENSKGGVFASENDSSFRLSENISELESIELKTGKTRSSIFSSWEEVVNVRIEQNEPLPLNITTIISEVEIADN